MRRQENDTNISSRRIRAQALANLNAGQTRHLHVQDGGVGRLRLNEYPGLESVARGNDLITPEGKATGDEGKDFLIVFGNNHALHGRFLRNLKWLSGREGLRSSRAD